MGNQKYARGVGAAVLNEVFSRLSPQERQIRQIDAYLKAAPFPIDPVTHAVGGVSCSRPVTYAVTESGPEIGVPHSDGGYAYGRYLDSDGQRILEKALSFIAQGVSTTQASNAGKAYERPLAVVLPAGMAALKNALDLIQHIKNRRDISVIVAPDDCYGGTRSLIAQMGIKVVYASDSTEASLQEAYQKQNGQTHAIIFETLTNPFGRVADIDTIIRFAKEKNILSVADSTLAPFTRPILRGADIDTISLTKYFTENEVILGGIIFNKDRVDLLNAFISYRNMNGSIPGEQEIKLALSGLTTMVDSYRLHSYNAAKLAGWLQTQPGIAKVYYPGFGDNPQNELTEKYLGDLRGGLMTIELKGGKKAAQNFIKATGWPLDGYLDGLPDEERRILVTADSFGAPRTLINYMRNQMSRYRSMSTDECAAIGITEGTLRVAVGTQDADIIIAAFAQALAAVPKRLYRNASKPQCAPK